MLHSAKTSAPQPHLQDSASASSLASCSGPRQRERSMEHRSPAVKCSSPELTSVISVPNSLARTGHMTLPNDKGAGSKNPTLCPECRENVSRGQHLGDDQVQPVCSISRKTEAQRGEVNYSQSQSRVKQTWSFCSKSRGSFTHR